MFYKRLLPIAMFTFMGPSMLLFHVFIKLCLLPEGHVALSADKVLHGILLFMFCVVKEHGLSSGVGLATLGAWALVNLP